ncbi:MAG: hypothetical protein ACK5NU_12070 [Fusobacterium ulcerans]
MINNLLCFYHTRKYEIEIIIYFLNIDSNKSFPGLKTIDNN